jgi:hypothetical protein
MSVCFVALVLVLVVVVVVVVVVLFLVVILVFPGSQSVGDVVAVSNSVTRIRRGLGGS